VSYATSRPSRDWRTRRVSTGRTYWRTEIADDLRSALAQIEDVLGELEQRVDAGASEEA